MKLTECQIAGGPVFYKATGVCGQYLIARDKSGAWSICQRIHTKGLVCLSSGHGTIEAAAEWIAANEKKGCEHNKKKGNNDMKELKRTARDMYKNLRDINPANGKQERRLFKSRWVTSPNHAGLYIESTDGGEYVGRQFYVKHIARDAFESIDRTEYKGLYNRINIVPPFDKKGTLSHGSEWAARQALRLLTLAYDAAAARELHVWHNAHTFKMSDDTPGVIEVWADHWTKSADIDTDMNRNGNGARLWSN